jgi:hypothetical protein
VSECDREASIMERTWLTDDFCGMKKKLFIIKAAGSLFHGVRSNPVFACRDLRIYSCCMRDFRLPPRSR